MSHAEQSPWWQDPARIADEIERCTTFAAMGSVVTAAMPTILVALRAQKPSESYVPTPAMISAAWATWHSRHGGKLGPGPAFREAIQAALAPKAAHLPDTRSENTGGRS